MTERIISQDALDEEVRAALAAVDRPGVDTVVPGDADLDVAVIGGGQSGVAIALALRRAGIRKVGVFDRAAEGGEGVWTTIARMRTLRTEKTIPGLDLGLPQLTFRHWFTRLNGAEAYDAITRIPPRLWQDYLTWYRRISGIAVAWNHDLTGIEPAGPDRLSLRLATPEGERQLTTRRLVLATGLDGAGHAHVPAEIAARIPAPLFAHSESPIDFGRLRGKRVGVIGGATSAFDAAGVALEAGAAEVHQFIRGERLADGSGGGGDPASIAQRFFFLEMPDALRWEICTTTRQRGWAPPWSRERATRHANHRLHFGARLSDLRPQGEGLVMARGAAEIALDFLILGTGYRQDLARRPELAALSDHVMLWRDRNVTLTAENDAWGNHPYLGAGFELRERHPGSAPWIGQIHLYTFAAIVSHGLHIGDIGTASTGIPRLVEALRRGLFETSRESYRARLESQLRSFRASLAQQEANAS